MAAAMQSSAEPFHERYRLLAKIGEGLRGPSFVGGRTGDATPERLFGIELCAFATGEDAALRRFLHDVERAALIQHRNVLGIIEVGAVAAGQFIVTEYVDGCTLSEAEDRHRASRPAGLVLAVMDDALQGLHAAHTLAIGGDMRPLIHGGLAPDQLRIGLDGICRISGFGNARPRVQTRPSHRIRSAAGYMTPEQLTTGELDHRSDLFALGIVLWNALTGKKLFHDRIEHMTMSNVLERKVPRPSQIGLSPPPELDAAVLKALERDPARRYQSADEMAAALRDAGRAAGCLAAEPEVGAWIATAFGGELATRRRTIRELASRPRPSDGEVPILPPLGGVARAQTGAHDELSIGELAHAAAPRSAGAARRAPIVLAAGARPTPRQLAVMAVAAFGVVALVLAWRISQASAIVDAAPRAPAAGLRNARPAGPPAELLVTVLDVRGIAAAPWPASDPPAARTSDPDLTREPVPAPAASRAPARAKKPPPAHPSAPSRPPPHPAEPRAEPTEPRPAEPRPEPAQAKPEPAPRPTLESNPYLYNK